MMSPTAWGAGGSAVVVPSCMTVPIAAKAAILDASALPISSFSALFFGGMTSSSDTHGGCQCCSRPKPSNTNYPMSEIRCERRLEKP